ncbi:MAG: tetratricopeptide repeat protein [Dysgonamonadaceae bacterium]|jgi:tetratricopeptide (TPR) repeat protein|nr:tetratricopeptide repeat protein [Dysgonamonadaceae bacterium]
MAGEVRNINQQDLEKLIKSDSLFLESIILKESGKYEEAFNVIKKAYDTDSTSSSTLAEISNYYIIFKHYSLAIDALKKAMLNSPEIVDYKIALAELYYNISNYSEAATIYEELIAENPRKDELLIILIDIYTKQREHEKAINSLNTLENNTGINEVLSIHKARLYISLGKKENAIEEFIKVCEKFPDNADAFILCGELYAEIKQYNLALSMLQNGFLKVQENNKILSSVILGQTGDIYHILGENEKAYENYEKALKYNENNIVVLNNYAYFLCLEKQDLDRAEKMIVKCVSAQPTNSTYLDTYAWIFFQKGNYQRARLYIENAITNIREDNAEIFDHYGDILFKLDKKEQAVEQWQKALKQKLNSGETDTVTITRKITDKTFYETTE